MRNRNRLPALLLALVMALSLTGTALAAETDETRYTDVPDWAKEYVETVAGAGLIDGKTADTFAPNDNMTRADLVVALYRLAGSPAVSQDNVFADVADDAAYKNAVLWAYSKGIVSGKGDNAFDPAGDVKRQEIAKILDVFAATQVGKKELSSRVDEMSGYPDVSAVDSWAATYMNWAAASGFIQGDAQGRLNPQGTATRAEVAVILCRYMDDASTGDAGKDKPRNGDNIGENELLVVSFGTSFNDNRVATIGAIEDALEKAFPDYSVRRGFTANIIIEHVFRRDGEVIDDVKEALDRAVSNGVKNLLVQPTHLMNGYEYGDLRNLLEKKYADKFETVKIGAPLLTSDGDFTAVAKAMVDATASFDDGKTAICFMGHGTEAESNAIYNKMQSLIQADGHANYFVGTVDETETANTLEDVIRLVKDGGYERVVLRPMMIVAGDHANNDMAGDDEDSWKNTFIAEGFAAESVICEIKGLGEIPAIQNLLVDHARNASLLSETAVKSEPNPENPDNEDLDNEPAAPAKPEEPAAVGTLADGVYTIDVESDSSMFRVIACELTVKDGAMTAVLTLSGTGYDKMYVGDKSEAENAKDGFIDYVEDGDGKYTFTVTVAALDTELPYAAHAVKSGSWYARTLTFDSATAAAK